MWQYLYSRFEYEDKRYIPQVVNYVTEHPLILPRSQTDLEAIVACNSTKHADWRYEKEFRFIFIGTGGFAIPLGDKIIKKVILGCDMPKPHIQEVSNVIADKDSGIELWSSKRIPISFDLEFEQIK